MNRAGLTGSESESVRLAKRVAAQVPCSRSEAERYIEGGWVRVDEVVVDVPQARVAPTQIVTLDAQASLLALTPVTGLVHQPSDASPSLPPIGTRWPEDPSGLRVTPGHWRMLRALLPLPAGAGGLAVFSQDPRVQRKLTLDALAIEQEWVAQVEGGLARLSRGLVWRGQPLPPLKVSWQSEQRLRLAFKGIDPAQIPWLCEQVGLKVTQWRRIRVGQLPLAGLPVGQWRALMLHERF